MKKIVEKSQKPKEIQRLNEIPLDRNKFDEEVVTLFKYDPNVEPIGRNYLREDHSVIFEGSPTWALEIDDSAHAYMRFELSVNDLSSYDYIDIYLHIDDISNMGASQIDLITGSSISNKFSYFAVGSNLRSISDSGWRYLRIRRSEMAKSGRQID